MKQYAAGERLDILRHIGVGGSGNLDIIRGTEISNEVSRKELSIFVLAELRKRIPQKPVGKREWSYSCDYGDCESAECPDCGAPVYSHMNFCNAKDCGATLDWKTQ